MAAKFLTRKPYKKEAFLDVTDMLRKHKNCGAWIYIFFSV